MIGKTISHYRILDKLGEGGMGVVYRAEDTDLQRTVALKFMPPELARDPDTRKRFLQEARAASALDHPNICTIHEIQEAEGHTFIVMSYVDGESVKERIAAGPLPMETALEITIQIALGLAEAHEKRIIHRDIKPANISLTQSGHARSCVKTEPIFRLETLKTLFRGTYVSSAFNLSGLELNPWDISPDGKRFLMMKEVGSTAEGPRRINIVLNWIDELRQRVPVK
jgi:serine/threonine protein kinase